MEEEESAVLWCSSSQIQALPSAQPKQKIRLFVKVMQYISSFPQA